jgi:hypothetical protein
MHAWNVPCRQVVRLTVNPGGFGESFVNHICRHNTGDGDGPPKRNGSDDMRGITIGVAATVLGTLAYVLVAVALASVG